MPDVTRNREEAKAPLILLLLGPIREDGTSRIPLEQGSSGSQQTSTSSSLGQRPELAHGLVTTVLP